jgi:lantibiotic modifying enzyme
LSFIKSLYDGGFANLLREYSVFSRWLVLMIEQWLDLSEEFIRRLRNDLPQINSDFKDTAGQAVLLEMSDSDPHDNGRTVIIVTFESGLRLVYKPKPMGLESDYFRFIDWLNTQDLLLNFKPLKVINRECYGWVEFVNHVPMEEPEQAKRYYLRSGMLLCLIYVLDGNDFHSENIVACGEHPVLIDLETIFHHRIKYPEEVRRLTSAATEVIRESVL